MAKQRMWLRIYSSFAFDFIADSSLRIVFCAMKTTSSIYISKQQQQDKLKAFLANLPERFTLKCCAIAAVASNLRWCHIKHSTLSAHWARLPKKLRKSGIKCVDGTGSRAVNLGIWLEECGKNCRIYRLDVVEMETLDKLGQIYLREMWNGNMDRVYK